MKDRNPLRVWRTAHGMTQTQAAVKIGVSMATLGLWEQGAFQPGDDRWPEIGRVMGEDGQAVRQRWADWMATMVAA